MKLPLFVLLLATGSAQAQSVVYKCPGPPVLYTDQLTPKEAKEKGCTTIEGASVSVVSPPKPKPVPAAEKRESKPIDEAQRARDGERRRVLEGELADAEAKLEALKKDYRDGEPERYERNLALYQQRVAEMKAAITRQEADIQALKREIAKLP
ncbi:hypothetical protein [Inhella gelatinilytica]|uniref:DUF4124 domain-containing protein n=1 Tax=Inhella gelatinilytica TaxID=2795030 RepID=A0A931IWU2_9BURK|nr:hypothetical protein [Inhella gelatinilytica]MBH9552509.1 hypothetical protein [Inhella gelatinilytica]